MDNAVLKEAERKLRACSTENGRRYDSAIILWEEADALLAELKHLREKPYDQ